MNTEAPREARKGVTSARAALVLGGGRGGVISARGGGMEDQYAGVRERVVNPIGIKTSKLSVTLLGHYEQGAAERVKRQQKQIEDQHRDFKIAVDQSKRVSARARARSRGFPAPPLPGKGRRGASRARARGPADERAARREREPTDFSPTRGPARARARRSTRSSGSCTCRSSTRTRCTG